MAVSEIFLKDKSQIRDPDLLIDEITNQINSNLGIVETPEGGFAANSASKVGLKALPAQMEQKSRRKGAKFTVILAGCSGTGKATFLNTLFGEELVSKSRPPDRQEIRERKFELSQDDFTLEFTAVDMPEFGNKMDNQYIWVPIVRYIDHHFKTYLLQEEQPIRSDLKDNRVHLCLYFLSPFNSSLSPLDIESMKEISKRVNLIPLIARSDTLNKDELASFKALIITTMRAYNIEICQFISDQYVLRKIKAVAPYAIIGSNTLFKNADGKLVRARKYRWGMVKIENPQHCDFIYLKEVLLSEHMLDLINSMESHYNQYRLRCLQDRLNRAVYNFGFNNQLGLDYETDGLRSYTVYKKVKASDTIKLIDGGPDSITEVLEVETRKRLDESIRREEAKFKEWKASLLERQKEYNKDLEIEFAKIKKLKKEIELLGDKEFALGGIESGGIPKESTFSSGLSLDHLSMS